MKFENECDGVQISELNLNKKRLLKCLALFEVEILFFWSKKSILMMCHKHVQNRLSAQ